jgi:hypothetical protein
MFDDRMIESVDREELRKFIRDFTAALDGFESSTTLQKFFVILTILAARYVDDGVETIQKNLNLKNMSSVMIPRMKYILSMADNFMPILEKGLPEDE